MLTTPIVLHHGFLGLTNFKLGPVKMSYFKGIDAALESSGHEVISTKVHPTGGIERRAAQLKAALVERFAGRRAVIVAHSMGGLDARHMITHLGMADRVAALVTISTPHLGTAFAEWCLNHLGKRLGGLQVAAMLQLDVDGIENLTPAGCARFNAATPDVSTVRYFSISASRPWYQVPPWAMHAWRIVQAAEGANDGLVSVKSARWGEHLETWPADHWHTVNKRFAIGARDIIPRYLQIVRRLKEHDIF